MKVDYHIHTLCSDGIYTVDEVFAMIAEQNIESFSLTDHDTVKGIKRARQLSAGEIDFITGLEITCSEALPDVAGMMFSIHLLGYGFDENNELLLNRLARRAREVSDTFEDLSRELAKADCPVNLADVPVSCGNVLQLSDVSDYIRKKYRSPKEKILSLLDSYNEKLTRVNIPFPEGIQLIHQAGGRAVWAHPFHVYHRFQKMRLTRAQVCETLTRLKADGLDGLESDYPAFCEDDRVWLRDTAKELGLYVTAGSDFHGSKGRDRMGLSIV